MGVCVCVWVGVWGGRCLAEEMVREMQTPTASLMRMCTVELTLSQNNVAYKVVVLTGATT